MLISHQKKFIFIHVYKVAGTSVRKVLNPYCKKPPVFQNPISRLIFEINQIGPPDTNNFHGHISAKEIKTQIGQPLFDKYFTFGFVRNPWDWQVSLYHFALQNTKHHQHEMTKAFGSFDAYLEWRVNSDLHLQKEFLFDGDRQIVNFIGKMENIQEDFAIVCDKIGIKKTSLPRANKSNRNKYQSYYNSYTKELVAKHFKEDIESFGYTFNSKNESLR